MLAAVSDNGVALQFASEAMRNNRDVVLAAIALGGATKEAAG